MKRKTRSAKSIVMQPQYASKSQKDRTKYKRKDKWGHRTEDDKVLWLERPLAK